jgi:hypothetical protein
VTRARSCSVVVMAAVVMAAATAHARGVDPYDGPQWPNVVDDAQWPNVPVEEPPFPTDPARPAILDVATDRIGDLHRPRLAPEVFGTAAAPSVAPDITGSTASRAVRVGEPPPSPLSFEAGMRYWYSSGQMRFGFSNGNPLFGTPTSTLDWHALTGHSGEAFARIDHKPTGLFAKAVLGLGAIDGGKIEDRDFFVGQIKFSDTTSEVKNGSMTYASFDVGWRYSPTRGSWLGWFVGYQYWREKATAYGVLCNQASFIIFTGCAVPGAVPVDFDTAVLVYEPTWHAARLGVEGKIAIDRRWSFSAELAAIPFAGLQLEDSHLLRQSPADLGPAPNILTDGTTGYGLQAEAFVSYALTPNVEIGLGARYWRIISRQGEVHFGPTFASKFSLEYFDQERFGGLFQIKGKF